MNKLAILLPAILLLSGCGGKPSVPVSENTVEALAYEMKVDGKVVEQEEEFIYLPANYPVKGLFDALKGKKAGTKLTVKIPPEKAYGQRTQDMIAFVPREDKKTVLKPGDKIVARSPNRKNEEGVVVSANDDLIEVDFNHPYAGKTLEYAVKILRVTKIPEPQK